MLSPEDLGIDERAAALLEKLPGDKQQAILAKVQEGVDDGKIRNASAYVASACMKPDALGIDERASELLMALPKNRRQEVMDKLRNSEGINNPSAWVVKACLKENQRQPQVAMQWVPGPYGKACFGKGGYDQSYGGKGGYDQSYGGKGGYDQSYGYAPVARMPMKGKGGGGMHGQLDASANKLLSSLAPAVRSEILKKLQSEGEGIRNPSAWVAKAAMQAGATNTSTGGLAGDASRAGPADALALDEKALELLGTLPEAEQESILAKLENETSVRNPSAWVVKAAMKAGATPSQPSAGGKIRNVKDLDAQAQELLQTLDADQQEDIMTKLAEMLEAGKCRNPSGWVVRAALNAGASPSSEGGSFAPVQSGKRGKGGDKGGGKGKGPYDMKGKGLFEKGGKGGGKMVWMPFSPW